MADRYERRVFLPPGLSRGERRTRPEPGLGSGYLDKLQRPRSATRGRQTCFTGGPRAGCSPSTGRPMPQQAPARCCIR